MRSLTIAILVLSGRAGAAESTPPTRLLEDCDFHGQTLTLETHTQIYCDYSADLDLTGARIVTNGFDLEIHALRTLKTGASGLIISAGRAQADGDVRITGQIYIGAFDREGRLTIDNAVKGALGGDVTLEFTGDDTHVPRVTLGEGASLLATVSGNPLQASVSRL